MGRMRMRVLVIAVMVTAATGCGDGGTREPAGGAALPAVTSTVQPAPTGARTASFCAGAADLDRQFAELLRTSKPDAGRTLYTTAQKAVSALAESAPAEIRADMGVLVGMYRLFLDGLDKVGFDRARLDPALEAKLRAPDIEAATDRIDAYRGRVCGRAGG